jgi:lysophospholipase L1-like esterase
LASEVTGYLRYVALGDSQTEGLWDGDDDSGLIGFADRLAAQLDSLYPGLLYANLAVRGRQIVDVLDTQLPQALAMNPDLISVCIGMNDATSPGQEFDAALDGLRDIYRRLAESGATVLTTTFPDVAKIVPTGRLIATRILRINEVITSAAHEHNFRLVDLFSAPSMTAPGTWSRDRMHASPQGHLLFTAAAAEALGLPGSNGDWRSAPGATQASALGSVYAQAQWLHSMFIPWFWNHLRGRSSGDGRFPKYPALRPVPRDLHSGACTSKLSELPGPSD